MNAFTRYIEELQSYETVIYYLREAVLTVSMVVWRFSAWLKGYKDSNLLLVRAYRSGFGEVTSPSIFVERKLRCRYIPLLPLFGGYL